MRIQKSLMSGLVLAALGLAVAASGVIGQQPATKTTTDRPAVVGVSSDAKADPKATPPKAASADNVPGLGGTGAGAPDGTIGETTRPVGGQTGASPAPGGGGGVISGGESNVSPATNPLSRVRPRDPQGPGAGIDYSGPAFFFGSAGIRSGETVPEDEHLETWISRALVEFSKLSPDDNDSAKRRVELRAEIAKGLDRIFEIRQTRRMDELKELESRVQKLRQTLETRATMKDDILKSRMDYLLREAEGLGWGDGIPAPRRSGPTGVGGGDEFNIRTK